jgi:hypothetical protein
MDAGQYGCPSWASSDIDGSSGSSIYSTTYRNSDGKEIYTVTYTAPDDVGGGLGKNSIGGGKIGDNDNTEDDKIQTKFNSLVDEKKYQESLDYIVKTFGFNNTELRQSNSEIKVTDEQFPAAHTEGDVKTGACQTINVPINVLIHARDGSIGWGAFVRSIGHEYVHVDQKSGLPVMMDHNEREFLAYVYTLTAGGLPKLDNDDHQFYFKVMASYYAKLPDDKKKVYKDTFDKVK